MGKENTERATASFAKKERERVEENEEREMGKRYLFGRRTAHYMGRGLHRFGTRSALMTLRWYGYHDGTLFPFQLPHPVSRPRAFCHRRPQLPDTGRRHHDTLHLDLGGQVVLRPG